MKTISPFLLALFVKAPLYSLIILMVGNLSVFFVQGAGGSQEVTSLIETVSYVIASLAAAFFVVQGGYKSEPKFVFWLGILLAVLELMLVAYYLYYSF